MRIVAGQYKGRRLEVPKGRDIRPTSDKVRGALFNALESRGAVRDACVLDLFCGTGALGLEALSRGAAHCVFVDKSRESLDLARRNAQAFGVQNADFILKDAAKLESLPQPVTLALLDPPYEQDLVAPALRAIENLLAPGALCVAETEKKFSGEIPAPYDILDERIYGETKIFLLRKE